MLILLQAWTTLSSLHKQTITGQSGACNARSHAVICEQALTAGNVLDSGSTSTQHLDESRASVTPSHWQMLCCALACRRHQNPMQASCTRNSEARL